MTTINRKEYYPSDSSFTPEEGWQSGETGTVLSLPCINQSRDFDGSLDYTALQIDDAYNIDDISVQSTSSALLSLAADIAAIRLQPRLIPTALTPPTVGGLKCTANDALSADKVWLSCGDTLKTATPTAVTALNAADTNVKALLADISDALGIPCGALWSISKSANNEVVSVAGGYSDGHVIMDGRSTMVGYPVEGVTDVVWTALGKSQLMVLNAESTKDLTNKTLLCRLLIALGMPVALADAEQAALSKSSDAGLAEPAVSDGVITLSGESNPLEGKSRMLYKASNAVHPWISVDADGASMLMWPENKGDVFALIAGMAKKAMDGIVGVGLVGVGKNGCPPKWILIAMNTYGIPMANLLAASAIDADIKKSFDDSGRYIKSNGSSSFDTDYYANNKTIVKSILYTDETGNKNWFGGSNYNLNSYNTNTLEYKFNAALWSQCSVNGVVGKDFSVEFGHDSITINGDRVATLSSAYFIDTLAMSIFVRKGGSARIKGKIKNAFIIYEDAICKRIYIPINHPTRGITMVDLMQDPTTDAAYPTKVGTFTIEG